MVYHMFSLPNKVGLQEDFQDKDALPVQPGAAPIVVA